MNAVVLSVLSALFFIISRVSGILSRCCSGQTVFSSVLWGRERLSIPIVGGRRYLFSNSSVVPFIKQGGECLTADHVFHYVDHTDDIGCLAYSLDQGFVYANLTLANIVPFLSMQMVEKIAWLHKIPFSSCWKCGKDDIIK